MNIMLLYLVKIKCLVLQFLIFFNFLNMYLFCIVFCHLRLISSVCVLTLFCNLCTSTREMTKMRILLTGQPGVGKTTACIKLSDLLGTDVQGFYTEAVMESGQRTGFDIVTIGDKSGKQKRGVLARKNTNVKGPKVGQYTVHVQDFESIALPCLKSVDARHVLIIDEIGKMEDKSNKFKIAIRKVFNEFEGTIIATIPKPSANPLNLVEEVKSFPNTEIITVSLENRNSVPELLLIKIKDKES